MTEVVVLGGGVTGCAAALALLGRGHKVIVLEPDVVEAGAPRATAGHLALGTGSPYVEVVRRHGPEASREIWEAYREANERVAETVGDLADDCGYRKAGGFLLARSRAEAKALCTSEDLLREEAFGGEFLDHYLLEARFNVTGFTGAYWAEDEADLDACALHGALAAAVEARGGSIHEASPVRELVLHRGGAEAVTPGGRVRSPAAFVAEDGGAARMVPFLEGRIILEDLQCALFDVKAEAMIPSPGRVSGGDLFWRRTADGLNAGRFDATGESSPGEGADPGGEAEAALDGFVASSFAGVSRRPKRRWTETIGTTPDGLPLVGPLPDLPAVAVCGHGRFGLALGLLAARWAAEALATGHDPTPARFRLGRPFGGP